MVLASGAPLSSTALFFAVLIKLGVAKDGNSPASIDQGHGRHAIQTLFICGSHRQHHGHRQVDDTTWDKEVNILWGEKRHIYAEK